MASTIDAMALYNAWSELNPGSQAKLRRVDSPDKLLDIPAFYVLAGKFGWPEQRYALLRMIFCLAAGVIINSDDETLSLGKALARTEKISPQRVMQLIRYEHPNDIVQLRRMLIHAGSPALHVHWPSLARQLQWWGKYDRRTLIEHFVLFSPKNK